MKLLMNHMSSASYYHKGCDTGRQLVHDQYKHTKMGQTINIRSHFGSKAETLEPMSTAVLLKF
eukprot:200354-Amphidinium_carterae.6